MDNKTYNLLNDLAGRNRMIFGGEDGNNILLNPMVSFEVINDMGKYEGYAVEPLELDGHSIESYMNDLKDRITYFQGIYDAPEEYFDVYGDEDGKVIYEYSKPTDDEWLRITESELLEYLSSLINKLTRFMVDIEEASYAGKLSDSRKVKDSGGMSIWDCALDYKSNPQALVSELEDDEFVKANGWFRVFHEGIGEGICSPSEGVVMVYDVDDLDTYNDLAFYEYNPKAWKKTANGGWDKIYAGDNGGEYEVKELSDSRKIKDMKRVKDSEDFMFVVYKDGEAVADFYNEPFAISYAEDFASDSDSEFTVIIKGGERDGEVRWSSNKVSDSRKIKDADETPDVLDGILMIAFNDGSEDDGYKEVKKHANEQGKLDGVQYETYDTDYQDGVTLIDLCAATDDANAFVKALLNEWGIIDEVADIEFEKSELMENAEVSDSKKIKDDYEKVYWEKGKWAIVKTSYGLAVTDGERTDHFVIYDYDNPSVGYDDDIAPEFVKRKVLELVKKGVLVNRTDVVSDSKVEDMTKPAHLRGYAEKKRKQRREQREENNDEETKQEVNDSRKIKDEKNYDFDYNDVVYSGYISNNDYPSLNLLEILADFPLYEGEEWSLKVSNTLQEYMDSHYTDGIMSNYGEKFYSADELPQWAALELLQTQIFKKEMSMSDKEAVKSIGKYFDIDFNEEPFCDFVEKYANLDAYFDSYQDEI